MKYAAIEVYYYALHHDHFDAPLAAYTVFRVHFWFVFSVLCLLLVLTLALFYVLRFFPRGRSSAVGSTASQIAP